MTGYTSALATGTVVAGEKWVDIAPKYPPASKLPGVMFVHGAGVDASFCVDDDGDQVGISGLLANNGYTAASGDNGGIATWGSSSALTPLGSGVTALAAKSSVKAASKVALIGTSMGGLNALNYALANPTKVSCLVLIIPCINLDDIRSNNRGSFAAAINAAYGGSYDEASQGATHNPYTYRASATIATMPMLIFYGDSDAVCLPTYTSQFAAAQTNRTAISLSGGHAFSTQLLVNHQTILDFIVANHT